MCVFCVVQVKMVDIKSLLSNTGQLLAGWVGLALSTATLGLFPEFPVFSVVDEQTTHDALRRTQRRVSRHDNAEWSQCLVDTVSTVHIVQWSQCPVSRHDNAVGIWVVAELVFFCLLTSIAGLLYCCCRRHQRRTHTRSGTWYRR